MSKSQFSYPYISNIVSVLGPDTKSIDDHPELYDFDYKKINKLKSMIGINSRVVVPEGVTTVDLCSYAAKHLFNSSNLKPSDVDGVILVTQTNDYIIPASACVLHEKLKLSDSCAAFDVKLGCSGYVYGLWLSYMMVETGSAKNVLLFTGDTVSNLTHDKDKTTMPMFGDGASVTHIRRSEEKTKSFFSMHTDGSGFKNIIVPAGGFREPSSEKTKIEIQDNDKNLRTPENLYMNGPEVFNFAINVEPKAIKEIILDAGKTEDDIDHIVFHQANKFFIKRIMSKIDIPLAKVPHLMGEKYGNQSGSSIPITICDELTESNTKRNIIFSGFGAGLSWGTCLLSLEQLKTAELICFEANIKSD